MKNRWVADHLLQFDISKVRFQVVAVIFIILWAILWGRAFYLQIVIGPELRAMSSKQHLMTSWSKRNEAISMTETDRFWLEALK